MLMIGGAVSLPFRPLPALLLFLSSTTLTPFCREASRASQAKAGPAPAGTCPSKFATYFPIFSRFACLYCDRNDSQLRRPSDFHFAHEAIGLAANKIDAQQAVVQVGRFDLDAIGQHEGPAE